MKKVNDTITINLLEKKVNTYDKKNWPMILKAYNYAKKYHTGQKRESGEDYIIHPLTVAYMKIILVD